MLSSRLRLFYCSLAFVLFSPFVRGEEPVAPPPLNFKLSFQTGVDAYQKKDYAAAQTAFTQALALRPEEPSTLTNLALTESRLGHLGLALGELRQVLVQNPRHEEARKAFDFLTKENAVRDIPHQIETWETLRSQFLNVASLFTFALFTLLLLVCSGWSWLTYLGSKKRASELELALPGAPLLASLFSLLFVFSLGLSLAKLKDAEDTRATVVVEKVTALTAPTEQSPGLFDLFEGLEVVVRQVDGKWAQVTYPGAMTGWVPLKSLMITQSGAH